MSHRVRLGNSSSNTSLRDRSALLGTTTTTTSNNNQSRTLTPPVSGRSTPFGHYNDSASTSSAYAGYNSYNPSGDGRIGSSGGGSGGGSILPAGHRYADDLEGQNDEAIEGLTAKVKLLKDITVGIGNEVRESTKQLGQMNDAFAETGGILQGTFRRMNNMASKQGCRWLWYIVFLIVVFWFFIVVWWFRR